MDCTNAVNDHAPQKHQSPANTPQKDKDLVHEVSRLRRSLDDAEGLGRDTKKEWAILRSENISLKERDVSYWYTHWL